MEICDRLSKDISVTLYDKSRLYHLFETQVWFCVRDWKYFYFRDYLDMKQLRTLGADLREIQALQVWWSAYNQINVIVNDIIIV